MRNLVLGYPADGPVPAVDGLVRTVPALDRRVSKVEDDLEEIKETLAAVAGQLEHEGGATLATQVGKIMQHLGIPGD